MQQVMPQRENSLDKIAKVLGIVNAAYGIKTDYERGKLMDLQRKEAEDKQAQNTRLKNNRFTAGEASTLLKVPYDTTDPDAVEGYQIDDTFKDGQNGTKTLETPFKYIPADRLKQKREYDALVEASDEQKGIYSPKRVAELGWLFTDKKNPYATQIRMRVAKPDGTPEYKTVQVAPRGNIEKPVDPNMGFREVTAVNGAVDRFAKRFTDELKPELEKLGQGYQNQGIIDGVKRGDLEPGQAEGLIATIAAGSSQKGVLTDRDFDRGSFSPTSIAGKTEQQIKTWLGEPTDRLKKLEWLNKANINAAERRLREQQYRQKLQVDDFNRRNAKYNMQINWDSVAPFVPKSNDLKKAAENAADDFLGE